jgi:hypothetical protein
MRSAGLSGIVLFLFALGIRADAQQLRGEIAVTAERQGVSLNIDANYYNSRLKLFALARVFVDETKTIDEPGKESANPFELEAAVGRLFRKGTLIVGPLAGLDSKKRVLAGANVVTKLRRHTVAYLGYAGLATDSEHPDGMRHRLMFDLRKDEKLFLRLDWKREGSRHEHCRLGVEFHTRVDKLNLPVYIEPFWNFAGSQVGVRLGTRL